MVACALVGVNNVHVNSVEKYLGGIKIILLGVLHITFKLVSAENDSRVSNRVIGLTGAY